MDTGVPRKTACPNQTQMKVRGVSGLASAKCLSHARSTVGNEHYRHRISLATGGLEPTAPKSICWTVLA